MPCAGCRHSSLFQGLTIRGGVLVAGTMDSLVQLLLPTAEHHPDVSGWGQLYKS